MDELFIVLNYECDDCGEIHQVKVDLRQNNLQTIIEQLEDSLPCPSCGGLTIQTERIYLSDGFDDYELRF